eukprot:5601550-Pleurochrysis_carterae.AAC.1
MVMLTPLVFTLTDFVVRGDASGLLGIREQVVLVHVGSPRPFYVFVLAAGALEGSDRRRRHEPHQVNNVPRRTSARRALSCCPLPFRSSPALRHRC